MAYKPGQRTSNFFAQTDNLKQTNSQDALARGQALRGAAQAGTDASNAEATNVQNKTSQVASTDTNFKSDGAAKAGNLIKGATTSVVVTPAAPIHAGNLIKTTAQTAVNGTNKDAKGNLIPYDEKGNPIVQASIDDAAVAKMRQERGQNYDLSVDAAGRKISSEQTGIQSAIDQQTADDLARKQELENQNATQFGIAGTNKYGELAQKSNQDLANEDFLKLLAEKNPSNVGLLANLYKGGMKDAALDSNVLNSQLQGLRQGADTQIEGRKLSDTQRSQSLKDYYGAVDQKKVEAADKYSKQIKQLEDIQKQKGELTAKQAQALQDARNNRDSVNREIDAAVGEAQKQSAGINDKYKKALELPTALEKRKAEDLKNKADNMAREGATQDQINALLTAAGPIGLAVMSGRDMYDAAKSGKGLGKVLGAGIKAPVAGVKSAAKTVGNAGEKVGKWLGF